MVLLSMTSSQQLIKTVSFSRKEGPRVGTHIHVKKDGTVVEAVGRGLSASERKGLGMEVKNPRLQPDEDTDRPLRQSPEKNDGSVTHVTHAELPETIRPDPAKDNQAEPQAMFGFEAVVPERPVSTVYE